MTLIAAFNSFNTPVLLGDFIVTASGNQVGLRKKIEKISSNFVVGWTGHLLAAEQAIRLLQIAVKERKADLETIATALTGLSATELGTLQVTLVGWVIDAKGNHCFRWNSAYPSEVFLRDSDEPMFDGSGEDFMAALTSSKDLTGFAGKRLNSFTPEQGALSITTRLMQPQMRRTAAPNETFGFAYEALVWSKNQTFEYVDDVLYIPLAYVFDDKRRLIGSRFDGRLFKYTNRSNFTVLHVFDVESNRYDRHLIKPLGKQSEEQVSRLLKDVSSTKPLYPFRSTYYCVFARLEAPNYVSPPIVLLQNPTTAAEIFDTSSRNTIRIRTNTSMMEFMHSAILEDQRLQPFANRQG